ncbi:MAG: DUF4374 domain-containing protein, partial [Pseudomonadota bacterium]
PLTQNAAPTSIIEDTRVGHFGVNGASTSMFATESGDIYGWHNGTLSGGFDPVSTTPSGFLRIQNGASTFDADYFFDVEAAGSGGRLFWADYIGDGKALGRVLVNESAPYWFSAFAKDFYEQKLVLIDLEAQTVTDVEGVPLHQKRYTSPLQVIDGKVLLSIETADANYVYEYDVATGVATQGSQVLGKTIKGFYDLTP